MSIKYILYRTPIPNDREKKKRLHARFIASTRMDTALLSELVSARSKYSSADVKGILDAFVFVMVLQLQYGITVKLEGIGTFYPTLRTTMVQNEDGTESPKVEIHSVGFRCAKSLKREIQSATLEKIPVKYVKGFTLQQRQNNILEQIKKSNYTTIKGVMRLNYTGRKKTMEDLQSLIDQNKIVRIGSGNQMMFILKNT